MNAHVLGISGGTVQELNKFHGKYKLNFPLAGDTSHKTLEVYGVWQEKTLYGRKSTGVVRTTYVIGSDGEVRQVFPRVKAYGHVREVLAVLNG